MSHTSIELTPVPPAYPSTAIAQLGQLPLTKTISRPGSDQATENHAAAAAAPDDLPARTELVTSKTRTAAVIACITLITSISTLLNGLTTVALPTLARDLGLREGLLLWPTSIQALTCGCTLLLSGSLADAMGSRLMYLTGCLLQAAFVLGCGLSRNAGEIIAMRGLSGIAISLCLPSAVSIITTSFAGRRRNLAFAAMGGGQPVGFSVGLVLGGLLTDSVGWRVGFYVAAAVNVVVFCIALWGLPPSSGTGERLSWAQKWEQVKNDIDWIGAIIASTSLAMLSYVFATVTGSTNSIKDPSSIALLSVAVALVPAFIVWVGRQERSGKPAIIPNSLWRNRVFTTICIAVFVTWGAFNALETILTFYFQEVQRLSAVETSIRFLPAPVSGLAANILIGLIVHRIRADVLVVVSTLVSLGASLSMAFANRHSSYWSSAFIANLLNPVGADTLFTISNLIITQVFPPRTQGLAGGVFNTVSQIGKSVGLALVAVIAASTTQKSGFVDKESPDALMVGYRATFWFCFALTAATLVVALWGLRRVGKVGHKRD